MFQMLHFNEFNYTGYMWSVLDTLQDTARDSVEGILDNQVVSDIVQRVFRVDAVTSTQNISVKRKLTPPAVSTILKNWYITRNAYKAIRE